MKKETLQEASQRYSYGGREGGHRTPFLEGVKWQMERSYSEEEVLHILDETIEKFYKNFYTLTKAEMKEQLFKQFKKK